MRIMIVHNLSSTNQATTTKCGAEVATLELENAFYNTSTRYTSHPTPHPFHATCILERAGKPAEMIWQFHTPNNITLFSSRATSSLTSSGKCCEVDATERFPDANLLLICDAIELPLSPDGVRLRVSEL